MHDFLSIMQNEVEKNIFLTIINPPKKVRMRWQQVLDWRKEMRTHLNDKEIINGQNTQVGNFIRVEEISVRCNIPLGFLESLSVRERLGTHTVAQLTAGIRPMEVENSGMQLAGQPLGIEAVADGERILLFSGIISEIHTDRDAWGIYGRGRCSFYCRKGEVL